MPMDNRIAHEFFLIFMVSGLAYLQIAVVTADDGSLSGSEWIVAIG